MPCDEKIWNDGIEASNSTRARSCRSVFNAIHRCPPLFWVFKNFQSRDGCYICQLSYVCTGAMVISNRKYSRVSVSFFGRQYWQCRRLAAFCAIFQSTGKDLSIFSDFRLFCFGRRFVMFFNGIFCTENISGPWGSAVWFNFPKRAFDWGIFSRIYT